MKILNQEKYEDDDSEDGENDSDIEESQVPKVEFERKLDDTTEKARRRNEIEQQLFNILNQQVDQADASFATGKPTLSEETIQKDMQTSKRIQRIKDSKEELQLRKSVNFTKDNSKGIGNYLCEMKTNLSFNMAERVDNSELRILNEAQILEEMNRILGQNVTMQSSDDLDNQSKMMAKMQPNDSSQFCKSTQQNTQIKRNSLAKALPSISSEKLINKNSLNRNNEDNTLMDQPKQPLASISSFNMDQQDDFERKPTRLMNPAIVDQQARCINPKDINQLQEQRQQTQQGPTLEKSQVYQDQDTKESDYQNKLGKMLGLHQFSPRICLADFNNKSQQSKKGEEYNSIINKKNVKRNDLDQNNNNSDKKHQNMNPIYNNIQNISDSEISQENYDEKSASNILQLPAIGSLRKIVRQQDNKSLKEINQNQKKLRGKGLKGKNPNTNLFPLPLFDINTLQNIHEIQEPDYLLESNHNDLLIINRTDN